MPITWRSNLKAVIAPKCFTSGLFRSSMNKTPRSVQRGFKNSPWFQSLHEKILCPLTVSPWSVDDEMAIPIFILLNFGQSNASQCCFANALISSENNVPSRFRQKELDHVSCAISFRGRNNQALLLSGWYSSIL